MTEHTHSIYLTVLQEECGIPAEVLWFLKSLENRFSPETLSQMRGVQDSISISLPQTPIPTSGKRRN